MNCSFKACRVAAETILTLLASMQCSSAMNERSSGHSDANDDNISEDKHSVLQ